MKKKGFTLVELLITLALIIIIGTVTYLNLAGRKNTATLTSTTQEVAALLREAQSDSMTQSQNASWGVHFDNTSSTSAFFALFHTTGSSYASGTVVGHYPLPTNICYATSSLGAGSTTDIIFNEISGLPSATTSLTLDLVAGGGCGSGSSTIPGGVSRTASGKIFFDDFNRSNL